MSLLLVMFLTYSRFKRPVPTFHSKEQKEHWPPGMSAFGHVGGTTVIQIGWGKLVILKKNTGLGKELWIALG